MTIEEKQLRWRMYERAVDNPTTNHYISWIATKWTEFKNEHKIPLHIDTTPKQQKEFDEWLIENVVKQEMNKRIDKRIEECGYGKYFYPGQNQAVIEELKSLKEEVK